MGRDAPRLVSVVIPVRNAARLLPDQLNALAAQDYDGPWEVVVADNGSSDGSASVARRLARRLPSLRVVDASGRRGVGPARNAGAAAAGGDLLAFCDADNVADPGWLGEIVRAATSADLVVGATIVDRVNRPDQAIWGGRPADGVPVGLGFMPFANGGNCAYWSDVFTALGGFDSEFEGGEDMDLSWRAQLAGYRLGFTPEARMHRRYPDRLGTLLRKRWRWGRAGARLVRHYRPAGIPHGVRNEAGFLSGGARQLPRAALSRSERGRWLAQAALICGRWYELALSALSPSANGAPGPPPAAAADPAAAARDRGRTSG